MRAAARLRRPDQSARPSEGRKAQGVAERRSGGGNPQGGGARRLKGRGEGVPATWRCARRAAALVPPAVCPLGVFLRKGGSRKGGSQGGKLRGETAFAAAARRVRREPTGDRSSGAGALRIGVPRVRGAARGRGQSGWRDACRVAIARGVTYRAGRGLRDRYFSSNA